MIVPIRQRKYERFACSLASIIHRQASINNMRFGPKCKMALRRKPVAGDNVILQSTLETFLSKNAALLQRSKPCEITKKVESVRQFPEANVPLWLIYVVWEMRTSASITTR